MSGEQDIPGLDDTPAAFDPDLAEAALEEDDDESLLDLFAEGIEQVHPRLARALDDGWSELDSGSAA